MAAAVSSSNFHQPAARRPISLSPHIRFLLNPLSNEELISNRSSLPLAPRDSTAALARQRRSSAGANANIETVGSSNKDAKDPIKMTTLIPLVLRPRSQHKRASGYHSPLGTSNDDPKSVTLPLDLLSENLRQDPVAGPSPIVYTKEDCEQRMEEVKSLFGIRRFKKCAARCEQLLVDSAQHNQPIYTTYLCFYAAISIEQCARSLPTNSDVKRNLFNRSLTYYQKAKASIASVSLNPRKFALRSRRSSMKSNSSSNRSSVDSLFVQFSLAGSEGGSKPTSPLEHVMQHYRKNRSSTSSIMRPGLTRIQKKVSFSESLPTFIDLAREQHRKQLVTRRDESWDLINRFPKPPSPSDCPSLMDSSEESEDDDGEARSKENATAVQRFHMHVKAFEGQLDGHINSINAQVSLHDKAFGSQNDVLRGAVGDFREMSVGILKEGNLKGAELQKWIARRRAENWERKRFDPRRYQELCVKALGEIQGDQMRR